MKNYILKGILQLEKNVLNEDEKKFLKDAEKVFKRSKTCQKTEYEFRIIGKNRVGVYQTGMLLFEMKENSDNFSLSLVNAPFGKYGAETRLIETIKS